VVARVNHNHIKLHRRLQILSGSQDRTKRAPRMGGMRWAGATQRLAPVAIAGFRHGNFTELPLILYQTVSI